MAFELTEFADRDLSVAMLAADDRVLAKHLHKGPRQEDLAFAYWKPSAGATRYTAVITQLILPRTGERLLRGNVAFLPEYLQRVLAERPEECGIALLHGHLGPGWQHMSADDVVAERDRLASAVAGRTGLPLVGLTRGTDGAWSGRFWVREAPGSYRRLWARTTRVVGRRVAITFSPDDPPPMVTDRQQATLSVWGRQAQADLVRTRVGVVGLGSVGSLVTEALSRMGCCRLSLIDFDVIEPRNLDRTAGAHNADVVAGLTKVQVAARSVAMSHTASEVDLRLVEASLLSKTGLAAAMDCDVLMCCVDRPWPRFLVNAMAYGHLIPAIDGGIMARVKAGGAPLHVDWRIHTLGPEHACMVCLGALRRSDVGLDMEGKLGDPDYIEGLSERDRDTISRRNVFPFSMSVSAHQVLQLVGLVTGMERIGGAGPQTYHCYPGEMKVTDAECRPDCEFANLTARAPTLRSDLKTE